MSRQKYLRGAFVYIVIIVIYFLNVKEDVCGTFSKTPPRAHKGGVLEQQ